MIHITEDKLKAAIQICLGGMHDVYTDKIEDDLIHSVKALAIADVSRSSIIDLYIQLVNLQKETVGATFSMGYSTRRGKHFIQFNNQRKRIECYSIEAALTSAIDFVKGKRRESSVDIYYTMF